MSAALGAAESAVEIYARLEDSGDLGVKLNLSASLIVASKLYAQSNLHAIALERATLALDTLGEDTSDQIVAAQSAEALENLANLYGAVGRVSESLECFDRVVATYRSLAESGNWEFFKDAALALRSKSDVATESKVIWEARDEALDLIARFNDAYDKVSSSVGHEEHPLVSADLAATSRFSLDEDTGTLSMVAANHVKAAGNEPKRNEALQDAIRAAFTSAALNALQVCDELGPSNNPLASVLLDSLMGLRNALRGNNRNYESDIYLQWHYYLSISAILEQDKASAMERMIPDLEPAIRENLEILVSEGRVYFDESGEFRAVRHELSGAFVTDSSYMAAKSILDHALHSDLFDQPTTNVVRHMLRTELGFVDGTTGADLIRNNIHSMVRNFLIFSSRIILGLSNVDSLNRKRFSSFARIAKYDVLEFVESDTSDIKSIWKDVVRKIDG